MRHYEGRQLERRDYRAGRTRAISIKFRNLCRHIPGVATEVEQRVAPARVQLPRLVSYGAGVTSVVSPAYCSMRLR